MSRGQNFLSHRFPQAVLLALVVACRHDAEPNAQPPEPPPPLPALVSCGELKARLDIKGPVQIVDTRPDAEFEQGRITGASTLPVELIGIDPGADFSASARARLSALLGTAGLRKSGDIVAVDDGTAAGFGRAALLCWAVALTGYERCSVLTGGFAAWRSGGLPIDVEKARTRPPAGDLDPILDRPTPLASLSAVRAATAAAEPALVDVRSLGEGPGIPGATQFPLASLFLPGGSIDRTRLDAAATNTGLFGESELIVLGNGPADGAAGWFALTRVLALENVRLYPEGLSGWRLHPELPGNAAAPVVAPPAAGVATPTRP